MDVVAYNELEELLELIDHELEVFDPIVDGPVEFAEGMAFVREMVANFMEGNLKGN